MGKKVKFVVEDEDIASKEALWSLYERWCKAFGEELDHDEMLRRFDHFRNFVLDVHSANKKSIREGWSGRYEVNIFADGKIRELLGYCTADDLYELPYAKGAVVYGRARPFLLAQREETDDDKFKERN
uniref:Cathepsin propeptide inhibitor domain-containing protein n=1 Tax=Oryza meridionalis TaxID=40149 RepID=A0A0E0EGX7_9ORYZ